ncbi:MAG: tRNA (N(6)-L-threonylcarbamoyladenosine(37)-C(2))-methylthiotransferase [Candidatus Aenigmatarchaeota archaeon]
MKVYIEWHGCSASRRDAEIIAGIISKKVDLVKNPDLADVIILNTCIVKKPTEQKMIKRIGYFSSLGKKLIITGCMPEVLSGMIEKINKNASMLSTNMISHIESVFERTIIGQKVKLIGKKEVKTCLPKKRLNPVIDVIEIASGCNHNCSYCITKLVKGHIIPYPKEMIIEELKTGLKEGCKEFWITAQDVAAYPNLPGLIEEITNIDGDFFVRLGMMNPANLLPIAKELVRAYKSPRLFKFLHLPLQSGSDTILESMNRGYHARDFLKIVRTFRNTLDELTLWTDVIIGYPGESEDDFEKTIKIVKKVKPDFVNISKFGKRPGTKAFSLKELPKNIVNERCKIAVEICKKMAEEANKKWTGKHCEILIDEWNDKMRNWIGRNHAYKPVVLKGDFNLGEKVYVEINRSSQTCLFGNILNYRINNQMPE